jgi:DMSO reductase anchor subunit
MRMDGMPLKYHRDDATGGFKPEVDAKHGFRREWNLGKLLGSHENAHIAFTLSAQAVMGAFLLIVLGAVSGYAPMAGLVSGPASLPALGIMLALMSFGLFKLNMHLGKPHRFYRGFNNLRHSPVSREIAGVSLFFAGLAGFSASILVNTLGWLALPDWLPALFATLGLLGAGFGGYYMYRLYRIPARPFWDHWHTGAAFAGTALSLGSLLLALVALGAGVMTPALGRLLAGITLLGLFIEGIGLVAHARDLKTRGDEGAVSHYEQTTSYGNAYGLRNTLLSLSLVLALNIGLLGSTNPIVFGLLALMTLASAILGRALFYVLVIPTTMPGAFFWKNKEFVEHARETGLAHMPQLGVAYEQHHAFRVDELLKTLTSFSGRKKMGTPRQTVSRQTSPSKQSS